MEKYILIQDNDCHWFVIPVNKKKKWFEWCEIPEDNEASCETPKFAKEVWWCTSLVEFTNFTIN